MWIFNLYAEYIIWNARLDEAQAGIKTATKNINNLNLRSANNTTLMVEREEELNYTLTSWWRWKKKVKKLV